MWSCKIQSGIEMVKRSNGSVKFNLKTWITGWYNLVSRKKLMIIVTATIRFGAKREKVDEVRFVAYFVEDFWFKVTLSVITYN